jgi:hypothetical protein
MASSPVRRDAEMTRTRATVASSVTAGSAGLAVLGASRDFCRPQLGAVSDGL